MGLLQQLRDCTFVFTTCFLMFLGHLESMEALLLYNVVELGCDGISHE